MGYGIIRNQNQTRTNIQNSINLDLLWTNPNPKSAWTSGSLSLDYSKYNNLLIYWIDDSSAIGDLSFGSPNIQGHIIYTGNYSYNSIAAVGVSLLNSQWNYYSRAYNCNSTKSAITFATTGKNMYVSNSDGSTSGGVRTDGKYCVPYKIYGVNRTPYGRIKCLFPNYTITDPQGAIVSSGTLSLPKSYPYVLCFYATRKEYFNGDGWSWDTYWLAHNYTTRSSSNFGTTLLSSGIVHNLVNGGATLWRSGGFRYESSQDSVRASQIAYSNKILTLSSTAKFIAPSLYYANNQADNGVYALFGLNSPLW